MYPYVWMMGVASYCYRRSTRAGVRYGLTATNFKHGLSTSLCAAVQSMSILKYSMYSGKHYDGVK